MAAADQSIGMMDGAYFVGRKEIIDWVNQTCALGLTKVEQTCTGAVACQILDSIYPGKIPMSKVDWSANKDYEYIQNYKLLQKAFTTLKIDRHIEVDKLIRGKYQDNLEFMQWYKRFYELNASGAEYDALGQREKGKGGAAYSAKFKFTGDGSASAAPAAPAKKRPVAAAKPVGSSKPPGAPVSVEKEKSIGGVRRTSESAESSALKEQVEELTRENEDLNESNTILRGQIEGLEKERDFYFGKLRDIESMLQELDEAEHTDTIKKIFEILYAAEGDFSVPDEGQEDEMM